MDSTTRFLEDGHAALEWAAHYLERLSDLPVLARVEPGEIRACLPAVPPEEGEPFADVLRDLDEILLPGVTHWQHPRYFAYFAVTASEPGIVAEPNHGGGMIPHFSGRLDATGTSLRIEVRLADRGSWTRAAATPGRGADAGRVGPR